MNPTDRLLRAHNEFRRALREHRERRQVLVRRLNALSHEEIAQVMEKLDTPTLEWAVRFEAMGRKDGE